MSRVQAVSEHFRPVLSNLIDMIAGGDTAAMRASPAIRVGSGDPLLWVRDYPGEVISLPAEGWDLADAVQVAGQPNLWSVTIPLWADAEGRSDLSLDATVKDVPKVLPWKSETSTSCESRSCRVIPIWRAKYGSPRARSKQLGAGWLPFWLPPRGSSHACRGLLNQNASSRCAAIVELTSDLFRLGCRKGRGHARSGQHQPKRPGQ